MPKFTPKCMLGQNIFKANVFENVKSIPFSVKETINQIVILYKEPASKIFIICMSKINLQIPLRLRKAVKV